MRLAFDEARHLYRLDDVIIPNVTRVVRDIYNWSLIPARVLERKRALGAAVHKMIELDVHKDLDEATLDPKLSGYLRAWRRFGKEKRFRCYLSECRVASSKFRYAGTLDLVGNMGGADVLIDTKTTYHLHPQTALQTAAYRRAALEMGLVSMSTQRCALYLQNDGCYRIQPHESECDFAIFQACLNRYNWKLSHGLIKETDQ